MKHVSAIMVLIQLLLAAGSAQAQRVSMTYISDPPGGTLYGLNSELLGPCPKEIWYDVDAVDRASGFLDVQGLIVRWPTGPEKASHEVIRILTNVTSQQLRFIQPKTTTDTQTGILEQDEAERDRRATPNPTYALEDVEAELARRDAVKAELARRDTQGITVEQARAELARRDAVAAKANLARQKSLLEKANAGDSDAMVRLGSIYETGEGVQDYGKALEWYRKATEQGNAEAQYSLGAMYYRGHGVAQDYKEAVKWTQKAAEQGHAGAQNGLGILYYDGAGVTKDYKEAARWHRKAAEQGHAVAQGLLGGMYYFGQGVPQDYKVAVKWYRMAADQGDAVAQSSLGRMYYNGQGVAQDYKQAVKWYRKAADQGDAVAQSSLGRMYYFGQGVPQDYKEAVKWSRMAAEQGYAVAQSGLGIQYFLGQGVPQDDKEGVKWYRKAAEQGQADAQYSLGRIYSLFDGVAQDYKEAVKWYRKAAEQGYAEAQYSLGGMYGSGVGVLEDYREAVKWLAKAAEQGHAAAQYSLGTNYRDGKGVSQDYVEAYKWFVLAAANGHVNVQSDKEALRKNMTVRQVEEAQRRAKAFQAGDESPTEEKEISETAAGQPIVARGTGFVFAKSGLVATNYHVISGGKNIRVYFPKADLEFAATVELKNINNDLAILKIKDFAYGDIFSQEVPFGVKRSSGVQLGTQVFTLGFPFSQLLGKSAKFSDGTISSLSGLLGSANLFQINNPVQPGNSGGPLFDGDGNLIGVVVAMLDAKLFYENLDTIPQNVNFAIKADYLINLISMLPEGASILSRKGSLQDKPQGEQINSLVPYVVTVRVR